MRDLESILHLFRCPETGQPVELLDSERLDQLNAAIADGRLRTVDGEPVDRPLGAALHPETTGFVYPVRDGIPDFMQASRLPV
jgi:uncharacterized protein YbaR (Trm112 family)